MADMPNINTAEVYRTVADLLPAEGRDFRINLATNKADGKQDLLVEGLTPMGKAWVPFLVERLRAQLKPSGIGVEGKATDLQTVNTVRRSVTEEFDEKLKARIADLENAAKRRAEIVERTRQSGSSGADEAKALNAQREAEAQVRHLKLVAAKVSQIRQAIEDRARKAAEKDKEDGQDWSVDPDAPLETLFDRTNAEDRMRAKEDAVLRMAEHAAQMDELGGQAVHAAKYYVLNK